MLVICRLFFSLAQFLFFVFLLLLLFLPSLSLSDAMGIQTKESTQVTPHHYYQYLSLYVGESGDARGERQVAQEATEQSLFEPAGAVWYRRKGTQTKRNDAKREECVCERRGITATTLSLVFQATEGSCSYSFEDSDANIDFVWGDGML